MNINILRYSLFGIAGGQEVDRNFSSIDLGNVSATQQCVLSLMFVQFRHRKFSDSGFKCFMNK